MTRRRITDQLVAVLAGCLIGVALMAFAIPDAWTTIDPASRPSQQPTPRTGTRGMTTDGVSPVPSPDAAGRTEAPDVASSTVAAIGTRPAPPTAAPDLATLRGTATWFRSPSGVSAAGPALRAAMPGWRGRTVLVAGPAGRTTTVLGDWMRADRLIDLHAPVFVAVCGPLSTGVCRVTVTAIPAPPETSTEGAP